MNDLKILSGGAAQGLVQRLAPAFKALTDMDISGEFGAVGDMAAKLRAGYMADIVILTATLVKDLTHEKFVLQETMADIGNVETAVANRSDGQPISVGDEEGLREALLAADEIFVPDMQTSTAGIHVAKVLKKLNVADAVADRLRIYPNGATAMRHLAASRGACAIGCTQSTEILNTPGIRLVGRLPRGYDLATIYTAAVSANARAATPARQLIELLASPDHRDLRKTLGFEMSPR